MCGLSLLSQETFMPNMKLIQLKTMELLSMFVSVDSVVSILFLSLSCLES